MTPHVPTGDRETERITPELVLVDPDLARRLRRWLPVTRHRRRPPLPSLAHRATGTRTHRVSAKA